MSKKDQAQAVEDIVTANQYVEAAARAWQEKYPAASAICFVAACGDFVGRCLWDQSDAHFDAFVEQIRTVRREWVASRGSFPESGRRR